MSEMPISEARDHISELVGRARYGHEPTILTHYGRPAAVVISFEEYQRLKHAREENAEYQLPPEIESIIEEGRRHPEHSRPRPRRANRQRLWPPSSSTPSHRLHTER
jgi:prevent-host-death family protein